MTTVSTPALRGLSAFMLPAMRDECDGVGDAVSEAVRALYDAFASRSRRAEIEFDACDHCVSPQEARSLARMPLDQIGADLLSTFILNASSWTWGTPDDLWYYLPRILELVATGGLDSFSLWSLFPVMGLYWRDWPPEQQDAVGAFITAQWQATITGYWHPGRLSVLDLLEASGSLGLLAAPYLRTWETDRTEPAALHLAWLVRNCPAPVEQWSREVDRWLSGPAPPALLRHALDQASEPEVAATISAALAVLSAWNRSEG